ncbi:hypothetical protein PISMIDRAFT_677803, partial [Pisolithus microcarpus 441]
MAVDCGWHVHTIGDVTILPCSSPPYEVRLETYRSSKYVLQNVPPTTDVSGPGMHFGHHSTQGPDRLSSWGSSDVAL